MKNLVVLGALATIVVLALSLTGCDTLTPIITLHPPTSDDSLRKQAAAINIKELERNYEGENGVYMDYSESVESLGRSTRRGQYGRDVTCLCRRINYVVLKAEDKDLSTFECAVMHQSDLMDFYAVLIYPDGTIAHFTKNDCKVQEVDNYFTYKLAYPNMQKGTLIEEGMMVNYYTQSTYFLQHGMPVRKMHFVHAYNPHTLVELRRFGTDLVCDLKRGKMQDENLLTNTYDSTNIPAYHFEPYAPYRKEQGSFYEFASITVQDPDYIIANNKRWTGWADSDRLFSKSIEDFASKESDAKAREICANCKTKVEKIDTITTWIQKHIEVVGRDDDRFSKAANNVDFDDIFSAGYSTSFRTLCLAQYMFAINGVENAEYEFFDPSDGPIDEYSPVFADYVLTGIACKDSDKIYLVFPNQKEISPDFVPQFVRSNRALEIGGWVQSVKDVSSHDYRFVNLNPVNLKPLSEHSDFELHITDDGNINVIETQTYEGMIAVELRKTFKQYKADEEESHVKKMLSYNGSEFKLTKYTIEGKSKPGENFVLRTEYTINNLVTVTPEEAIFQTSGLFSPTSLYQSPLESDHRYNPIDIDADNKLQRSISVFYPKEWKLSSTPANKEISNDLGNASVSYDASSPGQLKISISRTLNRTRAPKEKLPQLVDLVGRRSTLQVPTIIFSTK